MTSSPVTGDRVEPAVLRAATIVQLMTHVPDPRHRRGRRHSLAVVLVIAVGAVTAGARSLTGIGEWAHDVGADLLHQVQLSGAVPSEATIRRVIEALDAGVFSRLCGAWTRLRWRQVDGQPVIAIDGKTVRRATPRGGRAPHLVAAITHDTGLVIGLLPELAEQYRRSRPHDDDLHTVVDDRPDRTMNSSRPRQDRLIVRDRQRHQSDSLPFKTRRQSTTQLWLAWRCWPRHPSAVSTTIAGVIRCRARSVRVRRPTSSLDLHVPLDRGAGVPRARQRSDASQKSLRMVWSSSASCMGSECVASSQV